MKIFLILLLVLLSKAYSQEDLPICSALGMSIYTVNGVLTLESGNDI